MVKRAEITQFFFIHGIPLFNSVVFMCYSLVLFDYYVIIMYVVLITSMFFISLFSSQNMNVDLSSKLVCSCDLQTRCVCFYALILIRCF